MAEPVYVSVNLPNIITIGFIVIVVWTLLAATISLGRQAMGGGSMDHSDMSNMAAAA
jgi:hypothetical protein